MRNLCYSIWSVNLVRCPFQPIVPTRYYVHTYGHPVGHFPPLYYATPLHFPFKDSLPRDTTSRMANFIPGIAPSFDRPEYTEAYARCPRATRSSFPRLLVKITYMYFHDARLLHLTVTGLMNRTSLRFSPKCKGRTTTSCLK